MIKNIYFGNLHPSRRLKQRLLQEEIRLTQKYDLSQDSELKVWLNNNNPMNNPGPPELR